MATTYASFRLNDEYFVIEALHLQEVVVNTVPLVHIPMAPSYFVGMFNLRGKIVPVLNAGTLLSAQQAQQAALPDKIAVLRSAAGLVGLLVGEIGEVFRCDETAVVNLAQTNDGIVDRLTIRNERALQILSIEKIAALGYPRPAAVDTTVVVANTKTRQRRQCISFKLGSASCAIEMPSILSIMMPPPPSEIPESVSPFLMVRNRVVPIVNLAQLIAGNDYEEGLQTRLVLVTVAEAVLALQVDALETIVSYTNDDLLPSPQLGKANSDIFTGSLQREGRAIFLLDLTRLIDVYAEFSTAQAFFTTANISNVADAELQRAKASKTYIVVTIGGGQIALPINAVAGVQDYPAELQRPPGLIEQVAGIMNSRGRSIAVIDTTLTYSVGKHEQSETRKLVLFDREGSRYALTVDTIDVVIRAHEEDNLEISKTLYGNTNKSLASDCPYAVSTSGTGARQTLFVMDLSKVVARLGVRQAA